MSENENLGQAAQELELTDTQNTAPVAKAPKSEGASKSKPSKKDAEKKPNIFARASRWLRELRAEMKKVSWLSGKDVIKHTGIVLVCVFAVGIFIWLFDALAHSIIDALFALFG